MDELSAELQDEIWRRLDWRSILACRQVSLRWRLTIDASTSLWTDLARSLGLAPFYSVIRATNKAAPPPVVRLLVELAELERALATAVAKENRPPNRPLVDAAADWLCPKWNRFPAHVLLQVLSDSGALPPPPGHECTFYPCSADYLPSSCPWYGRFRSESAWSAAAAVDCLFSHGDVNQSASFSASLKAFSTDVVLLRLRRGANDHWWTLYVRFQHPGRIAAAQPPRLCILAGGSPFEQTLHTIDTPLPPSLEKFYDIHNGFGCLAGVLAAWPAPPQIVPIPAHGQLSIAECLDSCVRLLRTRSGNVAVALRWDPWTDDEHLEVVVGSALSHDQDDWAVVASLLHLARGQRTFFDWLSCLVTAVASLN